MGDRSDDGDNDNSHLHTTNDYNYYVLSNLLYSLLHHHHDHRFYHHLYDDQEMHWSCGVARYYCNTAVVI